MIIFGKKIIQRESKERNVRFHITRIDMNLRNNCMTKRFPKKKKGVVFKDLLSKRDTYVFKITISKERCLYYCSSL